MAKSVDATNTLDLPLALTMGDPGGIGLDIAVAAWLMRSQHNLPPFYLIADEKCVGERAGQLKLPVAVQTIEDPLQAKECFRTSLPVWQIDVGARPIAGSSLPATAAGIIKSIDVAVDHVVAGRASALVTNPISKITLYEHGFRHAGHTEYLAELAELHGSKSLTPVMMLCAPELRVVPATVHIPLADVAGALSQRRIVEVSTIVLHALVSDFGIASPQLAITGLNPHAGENGSIGREDLEIVAPAIAELRGLGHDVSGPHPADTLFHPAARRNYDAVVAMYHDQALIPIKTLAFDHGVNVTLGLPFVRTSPDHGTAFDIAGTGRASANSLIAALELAASIACQRQDGAK